MPKYFKFHLTTSKSVLTIYSRNPFSNYRGELEYNMATNREIRLKKILRITIIRKIRIKIWSQNCQKFYHFCVLWTFQISKNLMNNGFMNIRHFLENWWTLTYGHSMFIIHDLWTFTNVHTRLFFYLEFSPAGEAGAVGAEPLNRSDSAKFEGSQDNIY